PGALPAPVLPTPVLPTPALPTVEPAAGWPAMPARTEPVAAGRAARVAAGVGRAAGSGRGAGAGRCGAGGWGAGGVTGRPRPAAGTPARRCPLPGRRDPAVRGSGCLRRATRTAWRPGGAANRSRTGASRPPDAAALVAARSRGEGERPGGGPGRAGGRPGDSP